MKQPMLHITLLVPPAETERLTEKLRDLGCLHLEALEDTPPPQYEAWQKLEKGLSIARKFCGSENTGKEEAGAEAEELATRLSSLESQLARVDFRLAEIDKELKTWQRWGDVDPHKLKALAQAGLTIGFFESAEKIFDQTDFGAVETAVIERRARRLWFAAFGKAEELAPLPFENIALPEKSRPELEAERAAQKEEKANLEAALREAAQALELLEAAQSELRERWTFEQALKAFGGQDKIRPQYLQGWLPARFRDAFSEAMQEEPVAYALRKPRKGDRVPVELKNNRFGKFFEPITRIFQLPNYFEYDLTPFIAVFYPILFAYCLGDAGYGAVLTLVALIGFFSFFKKQRGIAFLALVLGLTTTVMGLIKSGSLFGVALDVNNSNPLISYLGNFVLIPDGGDLFFNAFNVALMIGVVQILSGVLIAFFKSWRYEGFLSALSQAGKFMILTAAILLFLSDSLALSGPTQIILQGQLILGVLLVMFFHDMSLAILPRLGSSVLPLFFIFTGLLGDVLSYVRLFALGVTSSVLGLVVNQIGMDMTGESWLSWVGAGAFLLFGHSLNFMLAALGAFIHPLRLTFVEFYNNAQFAGGGQAYQPFQKSTKSD